MATNFLSGFLALGTGSTSFAEVTSAGYARQAITFGPLVGGTTQNTNGVTFLATGAWQTVTQYALCDASGNLLFYWSKKLPMALASGQTISRDVGALKLKFPDLAYYAGNTIVQWPAGVAVGTAEDGNTIKTGPSGAAWAGQ